MNALEVRHLKKSFGGVHAVRDVSFDLAEGELLALIGPNGAGKTTCFNMLNGQTRPDSGEVSVHGSSIVGRRPDEIWRSGVSRTFQITATFTTMTVRENAQMAFISGAGHVMRFWDPASERFREQALALLERVGIAAEAERPCAVLSYGDLKRVELAIALANNPRVLLMDEPTAGMAPKERVALMALTREIVKERKISALFTEHDMDVVFGKADRIVVLNRGELIAQGSPMEIRADAGVQRVYLGTGRSSGQKVLAC